MMRIVIDMNLSPDWVPVLAAVGHSALHWSVVGSPGAPDGEIMAWAVQNDHVLLTSDLEFGRLLALTGARGPSVVQLRSGDLMPTRLQGIVVEALAAARNELKTGAFLTIDRKRSRLHVLPLTGGGERQWRSHTRWHSKLLSKNAVYVIRIVRPFCFNYGERKSPIAYIGRGDAQKRLTAHLRNWICKLNNDLSLLTIEIFYCEPRIQQLGSIEKHIEAGLLREFAQRYGSLPICNKKREVKYQKYDNLPKNILSVLWRTQGPGFKWGLTPLASSAVFKVSHLKKKKALV